MNIPKNRPLRRALAAAGLLAVGSSSATVAYAQQMPPPGEPESERPFYQWEVTPFAGYRMGGDFDLEDATGAAAGDADLENHGSFAVAANLKLDETTAYELFYSRQETGLKDSSPLAPLDLDVEYLHLGGTLVLNEELPVIPYMGGGLGITRISPQGGTGSEDTRFSVSLSGGLRLPVTERIGVRLEARGYLTFINSDSEFFCASGSFGGVCSVRVRGSTLVQFELLAGASFAF
jgi:opacity protein-like surface antigen